MKKIIFALLIVIILPNVTFADTWQFAMVGESFQFEYPPEFEIYSQSNEAIVLTSPHAILVLRYTEYEPGDTYRNRVARLAALYTVLAGPDDTFVSHGVFPTGVYILLHTQYGETLFTYGRGVLIHYTKFGEITDQDLEVVSQIAQKTISTNYLLGSHGDAR